MVLPEPGGPTMTTPILCWSCSYTSVHFWICVYGQNMFRDTRQITAVIKNKWTLPKTRLHTCDLLCINRRDSNELSRALQIGSTLCSSFGTSANTSDRIFSNLWKCSNVFKNDSYNFLSYTNFSKLLNHSSYLSASSRVSLDMLLRVRSLRVACRCEGSESSVRAASAAPQLPTAAFRARRPQS